MRRLFTGVFDPTGRFTEQRLTRGLAGCNARVVRHGALAVAFTGPAPTETRPLVLLDGFLTNRPDLTALLQTSPGQSCEALIARAYRRFGPGLLERLRGDFALLIWDEAHGEGLLARDPVGMRCVYLHEGSAPALAFAGELTHLLGAMPRRPPPDPVGVAHWLAISARPGPGTLYEGITRLEPASMLALDRRGLRRRTYWRPTFTEPQPRTAPALAQELRTALTRAVGARLPDDERTTVLMSGGLDSASVAAVAADTQRGDLLAHCGVFPAMADLDESELIELLRARLSLGGASASVHPGGLVHSIIEHQTAWELPLLGWGDFWTLPLLRMAAREGVSVTLGGDGGDELFGTRAYLIADQLRAGRAPSAVRLAARLPGAGDRPSRRRLAHLLCSLGLAGGLGPRLHGTGQRIWPGHGAPRWLRPSAARLFAESDDPYAWKRMDGPRWWAHPAHALTRGIEASGILEHQRQRAALAGVQARLPLLDPDLLQLALGQSPRASFDAHRSRPLLREAMAGLLPDRVRLRPGKAWFDSLIVACIAADEPVIRRLLTGTGTQTPAFLRPEQLLLALDALHRARGVPRFRAMHLIWRALTLECWLRLQADPDGSTLPHAGEISAPEVELRTVAAPGGAGGQHEGSYLFPS